MKGKYSWIPILSDIERDLTSFSKEYLFILIQEKRWVYWQILVSKLDSQYPNPYVFLQISYLWVEYLPGSEKT